MEVSVFFEGFGESESYKIGAIADDEGANCVLCPPGIVTGLICGVGVEEIGMGRRTGVREEDGEAFAGGVRGQWLAGVLRPRNSVSRD